MCAPDIQNVHAGCPLNFEHTYSIDRRQLGLNNISKDADAKGNLNPFTM